MKEAWLYEKLDGGRVRCHLCAHRCRIAEGEVGICGVRQNRQGVLYSLVYARPISQAVDPIEKKPLFHFYPGTTSYSVATVGCNFRCRFCQNADISQMPRDQGRIVGRHVPPEDIVEDALATGCRSISYTYTEPTIFFEYTRDIAVLARQAGLANNYVTNGYMTAEMLEAFFPYLDAANVDLKAFRDEFYRQQCGARLQPVLDSLRLMKQQGIWVEVTTLVIPGLNDDPGELRELAGFIAQELGVETPWHVSRFHPMYKMLDRGSTPVQTLERAWAIGKEAGLRYVYIGNVLGAPEEHTYCWNCGKRIIARFGFSVRERHVRDGKCEYCGAAIDGVGL
ncbi:MAG: AmmeMemoRadiSam system radical SAM enzyme [Anaerolineae bacterium]|nr:AmmeMemoRadiSam system radical SAM enzyme [Anaerolineae bacterium]